MKIPLIILLLILTLTLCLSGVVVFVWSTLLDRETAKFDEEISRLRYGMQSTKIYVLLGAPPEQLNGEKEVNEFQLRAKEWFSDSKRPIRAKHRVLVYAANDRIAYIYLNDKDQLENVLVAKKGEGSLIVTVGQ
jgi:hypothetical protein